MLQLHAVICIILSGSKNFYKILKLSLCCYLNRLVKVYSSHCGNGNHTLRQLYSYLQVKLPEVPFPIKSPANLLLSSHRSVSAQYKYPVQPGLSWQSPACDGLTQ